MAPAMLSGRKIWTPGGLRGWQDMEQEPQLCWYPTNNHTFKCQPIYRLCSLKDLYYKQCTFHALWEIVKDILFLQIIIGKMPL